MSESEVEPRDIREGSCPIRAWQEIDGKIVEVDVPDLAGAALPLVEARTDSVVLQAGGIFIEYPREVVDIEE